MRPLRDRAAAPARSTKPILTIVPVEVVLTEEELEARAQAELEQEIEAELAASLAQEITDAESLVAELDRDLHGGIAKHDRWRTERTDDQMVLSARNGDDAALAELLTKYRAFARVKARSYFLVGADREDIVQEGMIGLYKAIRDFNPDMQSSFRAFAELCVTRQIITAIKTATRFKHAPLNTYVSFSHTPAGQEPDGDCTLGDALPGPSVDDPSVCVISTEELQSLVFALGSGLSKLEADALKLYLEGESYEEMAERLGCDTKTIDNALQRVKRKVLAHQESRQVLQ